MSKNRERKEAVVVEINDKFSKAKSAVVLDYRGLDVSQVTELRKQFRENGIDYKVYKNRLVKLAIKGTEFESLEGELTGPNGIAFSYEDEVLAAKIAKDFSKKNKELELRSGVVDGVFYDQEKITELADIPSKDILLAKFMGSIQSPISKFAYLIKAIAEKEEN